ncbi:diguanylate cyclase domain-containing protein [Natranaerofaba carboxydovora]|uniref:sensor domain-containing diguanylate cyclase/phosphohydrolase n=1 Tax=Natranaerofaba carboxydovora TaxID=2742683 RepID=UPI001F13024B|nr:diguanylate cyclase [Natranaerofaba carboxydovora]UMZ73749.1 3'3'-cGAMP-specific phosphodiesterase 2 [Natranaerofaba carboxydovora]
MNNKDTDNKYNFYSIITDYLDNLIIILDQKGKIEYYNKACENITGFELEKARGKYYWELFCLPEEKELYKSFFSMLRPDQYPLELETQLINKNENDTVLTILWKYNALNVKDGVIKYHILNGTDLTSQIKDKKDLQELGEKYRTILHASPVSVISIDTDFYIKSWSSAAEYLLGWSEKDVIEKELFLYLNDPDNILYSYCESALEGNITKDLELSCFRKDGSNISVNFSLAPKRDYKGTIDGIVMVIFDITKRKEAEEKIRYLSFHDSLTGLYNRRFLEEEMKRLETKRQLPIGIIMVDLNGLKLTNDTYGHKVGDDMLKYAAKILINSCRKEDIIARWGGDEFVIFLPQVTKEDTDNISKRIKENSKDTYVENIPVSLSLGAVIKDKLDKSWELIIQEAEDIMYNNKLEESKETKRNIINSLLEGLEAKSYETKEHARRMQDIALKIAQDTKLSNTDLERLKQLIKIHDIGKINISKDILMKKEPLTEKEWDIIKKHPETGYRIVRATEEYAHIAEDILAHHECFDGSGYPRGLKGEKIPILARIVAIADAYEVMSSGRPYKESLSREEIIDEFKRCSAKQFDPELVEIFLKYI